MRLRTFSSKWQSFPLYLHLWNSLLCKSLLLCETLFKKDSWWSRNLYKNPCLSAFLPELLFQPFAWSAVILFFEAGSDFESSLFMYPWLDCLSQLSFANPYAFCSYQEIALIFLLFEDMAYAFVKFNYLQVNGVGFLWIIFVLWLDI